MLGIVGARRASLKNCALRVHDRRCGIVVQLKAVR